MRWSSFIILFSLSLACSPAPSGPALTGFTCPTTDRAWRDWLERKFKTLSAFGYTNNARHMYAVIDSCAVELDALPKSRACLANVTRFGRTAWQEKQAGHSLGLATSDRDYLVSVAEPTALPPELARADFLSALDAVPPDAALATLETLGLDYVLFDSRHLPTPDDAQSKRRLLVHVPGRVERFVQFGLPERAGAPLPQSISVVAVASDGERPMTYFNDWFRRRDGGTIAIEPRLDANGQLERCTRCHKSALLPVVADGGLALARINQRMRELASAAMPGFPSGAFGPMLGTWSEDDLSDAALQACSNGAFAGRLDALRSAMRCSSCHDGTRRGALDLESLSDAQLPGGGSLVARFVRDYAAMPPGASFDASQRDAIVACLSASYSTRSLSTRGAFERWLIGSDCDL